MASRNRDCPTTNEGRKGIDVVGLTEIDYCNGSYGRYNGTIMEIYGYDRLHVILHVKLSKRVDRIGGVESSGDN